MMPKKFAIAKLTLTPFCVYDAQQREKNATEISTEAGVPRAFKGRCGIGCQPLFFVEMP